jgi:hypothetical protein
MHFKKHQIKKNHASNSKQNKITKNYFDSIDLSAFCLLALFIFNCSLIPEKDVFSPTSCLDN